MRSRLICDLQDYAQTFRSMCRPRRLPDAPDDLECQGDPERLPEKLSHGKRGLRDAIFDLELRYKTEPAPPPDPAIAAAAVAEAAAAHAKAVAKALESGEEPPPPPEPPAERDPGMIGVAIVLPDVAVLQEAAAQVVTDLIKQLNSLPPFGVQVIEAMPDAQSLVNIGLDEPFVAECLKDVEESIADNAFGPAALVEGLQQHTLLIEIDVAAHCELYVESVHPIQETHAEVERFMLPAAVMEEALPDSLAIRMFRVTTHAFKAEMKSKALDLRGRLLTALAGDVLERNRGMKEHFSKMMERILTTPENAEQLAELQEYTAGLSEEVDELQLEQEKIRKSMDLLELLGYEMTPEDVDSFWVAVGQPAELTKAQAFVVQRQEDERLKFMQNLREDTENFQLELKSIDAEIEKLLLYTDIEMAEEYAGTVSVLDMRLKEAEERAAVINSRETLFELEVSDFTDIASVIKTFEPYSMLWTTTSHFNQQHPNWMHGTFDKLDANSMSENITAWLKYARVRASLLLFVGLFYMRVGLFCHMNRSLLTRASFVI